MAPHGVGAAFYRDVTENDRDGRRFRLLATDGRGFEWVYVLLPRMEHDAKVDSEAVERVVERRAGSFSVDGRLHELASREHIVVSEPWAE